MNPLWFRIAQNHGKNLTIPFIIGALRDPIAAGRPSGVDREEFDAILHALNFKMPVKHTAFIYWCGDVVKQYVVAIHPDYFGTAKAGETLRWDVPGIPDVEALTSLLWKNCEEPLSRRDFSCDDGIWRQFTTQEEDEIRAWREDVDSHR